MAPRAFGRRFQEFQLPADLLGIALGKGSKNAAQDGGGQTRIGRRSAVRARLEGLSDLYEPYLLQKEMSGKILADSCYFVQIHSELPRFTKIGAM